MSRAPRALFYDDYSRARKGQSARGAEEAEKDVTPLKLTSSADRSVEPKSKSTVVQSCSVATISVDVCLLFRVRLAMPPSVHLGFFF